jgi:hypothetical protein
MVCVWGLIVAVSKIPAIGKVALRICRAHRADKNLCFDKG